MYTQAQMDASCEVAKEFMEAAKLHLENHPDATTANYYAMRQLFDQCAAKARSKHPILASVDLGVKVELNQDDGSVKIIFKDQELWKYYQTFYGT